MSPRVLNRRTDGLPPGSVYVGRPSALGNQFVIGRDGTREEVVAKHDEWLMAPEQAELREQLRADLRGADLVCWCAPLPCHANALLRVANGPPESDDWPRVFVVMGQYGEWSDYRQWPVCAYPDEASAQRHAEAAAARAREVCIAATKMAAEDYDRFDDIEAAAIRDSEPPPEAHSDYDHEGRFLWRTDDPVTYFLYEVDLRDPSAAPEAAA